MNQDEVESQLSAMFDGELPSAECELLSRRIDRDEKLRTRWSRYALIGAAMRCEPVATARGDFAARVSRAVDSAVDAQVLEATRLRRRRFVWQSALAAGLVGAVAGLSLVMLRDVAFDSAAPPGLRQAALRSPVAARQTARLAAVALQPRVPGTVAAPATRPAREPFSYVTPATDAGDPTALRTELVDYIVAHSEYSTPLMRPDLLSAVISGEDAADDGDQTLEGGSASANAAAGPASPSPADASSAAAGDADAPTAATASGR